MDTPARRLASFNKIRKYVEHSIERPQALAEFVSNLTEPYVRADEGLILGHGLACRQELWESRAVQDALRSARFSNENLGVVFSLLGASSLTSEHERALARLFGRKNSYLLSCEVMFRLVTSLHQRGVADAKSVLLPRLRWYSRRALWENAVLTFRVCAPSLLQHRRFCRIASIRSRRCRILLRLLSADYAWDSPEARETFGRAVAPLSRLSESLQFTVVLDISWICNYEGPGLARRLLLELVRAGDYRGCEILMAFVPSTDRETLTRLVAGPNPRAADWAKAR